MKSKWKRIKKALQMLQANKIKKKGGYKLQYSDTFDFPDGGISYSLDPMDNTKVLETNTNEVYFAFELVDPINGIYKLVTMYPRVK